MADNSDKASKATLQAAHSDTIEHMAVGKRGFGLIFSQDSGFILKKDGLPFLLSVTLTDTSGSQWTWSQVKDNDTIGKYYQVKQTGNFFVCTIELTKKYAFVSHLLLEIKSDGTILKNERFIHGNYPCCWDNFYEGFKKRGEYFYFKTCGTGSGYCGSRIYLFKNIISQDKQNAIPESYRSFSGDGQSEVLTSTMELRENYIIMHYKLETGNVDRNSKNFKAKKKDKFDIKYILHNSNWVATDSTKIKDLDL